MRGLTDLLRVLRGRILGGMGDRETPANSVVAAGGILWKRTPDGLKCAVVFRGRYQGEPGLPKGKVRVGESLEQAALREVEEETGCEALLLGYVGSISYTYGDTRKFVFFWNMAARGEGGFRPSEEVERVEWLTPERAMETLKHREEQAIVALAARGPTEPTPVGMLGRCKRLWVESLPSARYARLDGALRVAQAEVERRICGHVQAGGGREGGGQAAREVPGSTPCWADAALRLLAEARSHLGEGRIDQAWTLLHAARRMEILALDDRAELPAMAAVLRREAEKLRSWRRNAVHDLLGTQEKPKGAGAAEVYQAAEIRDEHYHNQAYKDRLVRTQVLSLALILAAEVAGLLWMAWSGDLSLAEAATPQGFSAFVGIALFGLLGGTVSAMLRVSDTDQSARIPETTAAFRVTFLRICMGAASAVVIYVFLHSQLPGILNATLAEAVEGLRPATAYAIAFVAGFTERLVLRAVEHISGRDAPKASAKK